MTSGGKVSFYTTARSTANMITAQAVAVAARDVIGVGAVASISFGAWMIYPPAGFIVGGLMVLAGVVVLARASASA